MTAVRFAAQSRGPTYKVALLGELDVGKNSLLRRLKDNAFDEYQTATERPYVCDTVVKVDGKTVVLNVWDVLTYDRSDELRSLRLTQDYNDPKDVLLRDVHAFVFVYSVSEASSLPYLTQWVRDVANMYSRHDPVRMLIGNKVDLEPEIDPTTAITFATAHEFELQFSVSCKTNSGIGEAFEQLARVLCQRSRETDSIIRGTEFKPV